MDALLAGSSPVASDGRTRHQGFPSAHGREHRQYLSDVVRAEVAPYVELAPSCPRARIYVRVTVNESPSFARLLTTKLSCGGHAESIEITRRQHRGRRLLQRLDASIGSASSQTPLTKNN